MQKRIYFNGATPRTSASKRLSKAEISEILDSPHETNYTYCDSKAYKPNMGTPDYVHPRLCRQRSPDNISHSLTPRCFSCLSAGDAWRDYRYGPQHFGKRCFFFCLFLMLLLAGYPLYGNKQPIEESEKPDQRQLLELKREQPGIFIHNKTQPINAIKVLTEPTGSIAYRERFVVQFFGVDYCLPFDRFAFWNSSVSFSFLHR